MSELKTIEHLSVDSSGRLTSGNLRSRLGNFCCNTNSKYIYFEHAPDLLTLKTVIEAIAKWLGVITPRFGFSDIQPKYTSLQYHMGTPGPSYGEAYQARIKAHEYARHNDPAGNALLRGHLLDVFEMNILSPAHLSHRVFGTKLSDWIGKGQRGELRELKKDVFAWFVPDDIRPDVRANLLRGKHLIVPV